MIRKCFFSIALSLMTLTAVAQIGAGQWKIHPYYVVDNITNCVDVGDKVYYLVGGSLFCYDKESQETVTVDVSGTVNDMFVKQIYYNSKKGYLFIVYENCNIDIVTADGTVVNLSAIKDVVLSKAKSVNDITFADGFTYIATSFGYMTIEDDTFNVLEVRYYDINLPSVAQVGDYKIMSYSDKYYYSLVSEQVETARWHKQADNPLGKGTIYPINDNHFFFTTNSAFYVVEITAGSDGTLTFESTQVVDAAPASIQTCPGGFVASHFHTGDDYKDYYYTLNSGSTTPNRHNGEGVYSSRSSGNWWIMTKNGLQNMVSGNIVQTINPNGITIKERAYWSTYDPYQQRVLLCRTAENRVLETYMGSTTTEINSWDGAQWHNITPPDIDPAWGGNFWIKMSPNEPDTYFYSFRKLGGVAKVKNNNVVVRYSNENAPNIVSLRAVSVAFDSKGNLWMAQPYGGLLPANPNDPSPDVIVLTPEKQALDEVTAADFIVNDMGKALKAQSDGFKRQTFDIGAGDTKVFSAGNFNDPLVIWNNNADLSLKQYRVFDSFFDQENRTFTTYGWVYIKADKAGMIWVGTVAGVISFDPREAFNPDFRINRIQVKVDQGTNVDGFLLEGTQVNCIDVDSQNRKWIGTNTNGIYLVSADGSEIIKHFNMKNSPLPTDQIYSVCYNQATNSVLVVTGCGVLEYFCDITPSASDYANVYAYPNPVQSTFTGYVTIKGLMNNSTVVITDAAGTKVATLTSTGGIAMWDACNSNGVPVKTGVYKVYAAQGSTPSTSGKPLAKIAVIK